MEISEQDMSGQLPEASYQPFDASSVNPDERSLDLVFVLDVTGSMGSYISSATENIEIICDEIVTSEKLPSADCIRIGLIAYRDHPPQDSTFVTRVFPLVSDVREVKANLKTLNASGGGDGPEASTAALAGLFNLQWRPTASKMAVLITDAPPHGLGEYGDGFPRGSPDGHDPLQVTRRLASLGISLFVVACEPALSGYSYAVEFYRALTELSSAVLLPLTSASLLAHVIVGSALEHMQMDRLIREVGEAVAERMAMAGENASVDDVAKELHERLMLRNESTRHLVLEDIYKDTPQTRHNTQVWLNSGNLDEGKPHLQKVIGTRFTDKYLSFRHTQAALATYLPKRPGRPITPPTYSPEPSSPPTTTASPSSPSRKIVSEFKPFTAPEHMSFRSATVGGSASGTGESSEPNSSPRIPSSSFESVRPSGADKVEEEEDAEEAIQNVAMRFEAISFDQARRIATSSIFRAQK